MWIKRSCSPTSSRATVRALGETRLGTVLFVVVALGFAAYGVYCLADAAIRRA